MLLLLLALSWCCTRAINFQHQLLELEPEALQRQLQALDDYLARFVARDQFGKIAVMQRVIDSYRANETRLEPLVHLQRLCNSHALQMHHIRKRFLADPVDDESRMTPGIVALVLYDFAEDQPLQSLLMSSERARMARLMEEFHGCGAEWTREKRDRLRAVSVKMAELEAVRRDMQRFRDYPECPDRAYVDRAVHRLAHIHTSSGFQHAVAQYRAAKTTAERRPLQHEVHRLWLKSQRV